MVLSTLVLAGSKNGCAAAPISAPIRITFATSNPLRSPPDPTNLHEFPLPLIASIASLVFTPHSAKAEVPLTPLLVCSIWLQLVPPVPATSIHETPRSISILAELALIPWPTSLTKTGTGDSATSSSIAAETPRQSVSPPGCNNSCRALR